MPMNYDRVITPVKGTVAQTCPVLPSADSDGSMQYRQWTESTIHSLGPGSSGYCS